jgi:hypothetical protein
MTVHCLNLSFYSRSVLMVQSSQQYIKNHRSHSYRRLILSDKLDSVGLWHHKKRPTLSRSEESFGSIRVAPLMCNSVLDGVVNFTPWPLYSQGKNIWYPPNRRFGWPQSMSGRSGEQKKSVTPAGNFLKLYKKKNSPL